VATVTTDEQIEQLEHVFKLMDECAEILRSLGGPQIEAYCLADFEGGAASFFVPASALLFGWFLVTSVYTTREPRG
jgi:hypothetical protein